MENNNKLPFDIDAIHTTKLGIDRIKKNLKLNDDDIIEYCKLKITKDSAKIYKKGKNWYIEIDGIIFTINSYNFCVITAHRLNKNKDKHISL